MVLNWSQTYFLIGRKCFMGLCKNALEKEFADVL